MWQIFLFIFAQLSVSLASSFCLYLSFPFLCTHFLLHLWHLCLKWQLLLLPLNSISGHLVSATLSPTLSPWRAPCSEAARRTPTRRRRWRRRTCERERKVDPNNWEFYNRSAPLKSSRRSATTITATSVLALWTGITSEPLEATTTNRFLMISLSMYAIVSYSIGAIVLYYSVLQYAEYLMMS